MAVTSSPLSSPPRSQTPPDITISGPKMIQYHKAQDLPFELAQHVETYYEESLFTQAYSFLFSIVSNSISPDHNHPVSIPSATHLALAATIAVHPSLTTRTNSHEKWEQASAALRLLRLIHKIVGPVNAEFAKAFHFTKFDWRVNVRSNDAGQSSEVFNTPYAHKESLWSRAEDFWEIVGWSFNCSCLTDVYTARWNHWKLWLEFMLDVLETDWDIHHESSTTEKTLIWQYVPDATGGYGSSRRMLRAIFADGTTKSLNEFREIFRNELTLALSDEIRGKIDKRTVNVNVDAEVYGDYLAPDESDLSEEEDGNHSAFRPNKRVRTRTSSARRNTPRASRENLRNTNHLDQHTDTDNDSPTTSSTTQKQTLGGPSSISLRLRILHLLSHVAGDSKLISTATNSFPDLTDLYTLYVEFIKPLPLTLFTQITLSTIGTPTHFSTDAHTTLAEMLLQRLLESSAASSKYCDEKFLTQKKLVSEYLPFAAGKNTIDAQARVSVLLETLLRALKKERLLNWDEDLDVALDKGIRKREGKARDIRGGGGGSGRGKTKRIAEKARGEDEAWNWLVESGRRMRDLIGELKGA